jgi:hypothetical protein
MPDKNAEMEQDDDQQITERNPRLGNEDEEVRDDDGDEEDEGTAEGEDEDEPVESG